MKCFWIVFLALVPISLSWAEEKRGQNTLTEFGLVGDGRTDDSAAIQAAVDAGVGDLSFSRGTYLLSQPVVIDLAKVGRTSIRGGGVARFVMASAGPAFSFVGTHKGTAAPKTFVPATWQRESTPMVSGIEIVGQHELADGIEATGTMQLTLAGVVVRNARHGIHLTQRNRNVVVSECHLYDNKGIGLYLDGVNLHQINIANSHISYNDGGGVVARRSEIRNLQIGTCDIEGNMGGPDSEPTANVLLDSTDSSVGEVTIVGCTIQHSHDAPDSANIRINGKSLPRAYAKGELRHGNITIANNVLSDVQVNIHLQNVRAATITGNTIWKGYDRDLIVAGSQSVVISGNVFDRNPRYGYGDGKDAKRGWLISDCSDCTFSGNQISGVVHHDAAVEILRSKRINAVGFSILDYGTTGLLLDTVVDSQFSACMIRDDRDGTDGVSVRLRDIARTTLNHCNLSHGKYEMPDSTK